jgi:GTP-binding protein
MHSQLPVVVLVGRPNVGKSTLFNRLTGSRDALVADRPGVTRDRHYGYANVDGRRFLVVDTGGLGVDDVAVDELARRQTEIALAEADAVLFVLDAGDGLTPADETVANRLRRLEAPVYAVVNKAEGRDPDTAAAEFHALGLGAPRPISAKRGDRVAALAADVAAALPDAPEPGPDAPPLRMAVLGRPNAGKSTLVNRLLGEERMLALAEPGTTRDAVAADFEFDGRAFTVVDTAGVRRRSRIDDPLEKFSVIKALQAAEAAEAVILMIDAHTGVSAQDARLLGLIAERGRAGVIAVNKWDGLAQEERERIRLELEVRLPFLNTYPMCFVSAKHGSGLRELMQAAVRARTAAAADLPTAELSRVLEKAVAAHAPPAVHGRRIKLRYAHQGGRFPPRIVIHGNRTERLNAEYKRYLMRRFREAFDLYGTPVELVFRTGDNPYRHRR